MADEQTSDAILQGPDGVCSAQTARDIKLTIQTLERICSTLEEISPLLLDSLDLKALTTLVAENLFAEMRQGNEMPLVLQFAHRFSFAMREYLKRITKCSFIYYTSPSSYYSKQVGFLSFEQSLNAKASQKCLSNKTTAGSNENVEGGVWAKCATANCAKHDH